LRNSYQNFSGLRSAYKRYTNVRTLIIKMEIIIILNFFKDVDQSIKKPERKKA